MIFGTGIWTRNLPNASLVRFLGATSLGWHRDLNTGPPECESRALPRSHFARLAPGFEPGTSRMPISCVTTESLRKVGTGIWTRDLPNASLVRYHGATSLGLSASCHTRISIIPVYHENYNLSIMCPLENENDRLYW